jgi:phosphoglycerol transferase
MLAHYSPDPVIAAPSRLGRALLSYLVAVILCLLILVWVLQLWQFDLSIPLHYHGDGLYVLMSCKSLAEQGWYLHNDSLGAPFTADFYDYPRTDNLHFGLIKILALFTSDAAVLYNLYFLLTFPLTTLTAFCVLRGFRCSTGPALLGSLLFTFLPYHLLKRGHLFEAAYYMVPLTTMVIVWAYRYGGKQRTEDGRQRTDDRAQRTEVAGWSGVKFCVAVGICLLTASAGIYYAYFASFLLLVAGLCSAFTHRRIRPMLLAVGLVGVLGAGVVANALPTLIYHREHGPNPAAVQRAAASSEYYGLKITQLLLPVSGHRLSYLADFRDNYNATAPLVNENGSASLGTIGAIALMVLLARLTLVAGRSSRLSLFYILSVLSIAAILFSTVGGFGSCVSYLVGPYFRAYTRISIYIAFFSFLAAGLFFEKLARTAAERGKSWIFHSALAVLIPLGVADMTSDAYVPLYPAIADSYVSDRAFVSAIEGALPAGAMVFQLPVTSFPESMPVEKLVDYDLFRGYLHSRQLRWSYGSMKGREGDWWLQTLARQPLEKIVQTIAFAGFGGITIDRAAYPDHAAKLEGDLSRLLLGQPTTSPDGRMSFFNMAGYTSRLRATLSVEHWASKRSQALRSLPFRLRWIDGFQGEECTADGSYRWCAGAGSLTITNLSAESQSVMVQIRCAAGTEKPARLKITSDFLEADMTIQQGSTTWSQVVSIPPGEHIVQFACDGPRVISASDPRVLVFRLDQFQVGSLP